jgi:hypothetical protein
MESQQSQAWFTIAKQVDALLRLPGAKERFRERVREAATEWQRRSDGTLRREIDRSEALERLGGPSHTLAPFQPDPLPPDPRDGSFRFEGYGRRHDADGAIDPRKPPDVLQAWLPAELSPDLDPDASLPLPVPENRAVSLAERYAVLAAVWDGHWDGDEKLDPWRGWQHCRPGLMSEEEYARYKQEGMPGIAYAMLVNLIGLTKGDAPTVRLSERDRAIVDTWIADVTADLGNGGGDDSADCYVTLQQAAAMVNRSKRTLEKLKAKMPMPRIPGGGGKADEWAWSELRPWLQEKFERPLPETFPPPLTQS